MRKKYKATPNDHVLLFSSSTEIKRIDDPYPLIPMQRFYFTEFVDVPSRADINHQLTGNMSVVVIL
jgi:hypothetical protein